jgi:aryl-alcohol dehydrogenase-like predicted oxidoreductase
MAGWLVPVGRRMSHMLRRPLGSTGLRVTSLGLGLAAIGRPGYITFGRDADLGRDRAVPTLRRRAYEVLDAAYAAGVRYFDVARSYGLAEEFLASWLERQRLPPEAVVVGSKWGYTYTGNWRVDAAVHEVKDHSLDALLRQVGESREVMGKHLQLYQVHSATLESGVLGDQAVLAELARLRQQGLTIGLTLSGADQALVARLALAVEVDGRNPFSCVQATWNLLETSAGSALAEAHAEGWGVIIKEALANGRLTPRGTGPALGVLREVSRELGATVDAVAIAAAAAQPWNDVVLSGAVTAEQMQSNATAADLTLSDEDLARLGGLADDPVQYWATRRTLRWT